MTVAMPVDGSTPRLHFLFLRCNHPRASNRSQIPSTGCGKRSDMFPNYESGSKIERKRYVLKCNRSLLQLRRVDIYNRLAALHPVVAILSMGSPYLNTIRYTVAFPAIVCSSYMFISFWLYHNGFAIGNCSRPPPAITNWSYSCLPFAMLVARLLPVQSIRS